MNAGGPKEVVVAVEGGLCNRLRAALSARAVSARNGWPVRVAWGRDAACMAEFADLFEPIDTPLFRIASPRFGEAPDCRKNLHLPGLFRRFRYDRQRANFCCSRDGDLSAFAAGARRTYVSTCYVVADYPATAIQELRPRPHLQRAIDGLSASFTNETVGVHIRRTDHRAAIETSTTETFFRAFDREIEKNPHASFFLATDDEALKTDLLARYPGRFQAQHIEENRRDTRYGMECAVVDLWCLARTRKLLGSYYSSFTDAAAALGGIPLEVMRA